jgi:hypothetical protein
MSYCPEGAWPEGPGKHAQGLPWETRSKVTKPSQGATPLRPREKHPARRVGDAEGAPGIPGRGSWVPRQQVPLQGQAIKPKPRVNPGLCFLGPSGQRPALPIDISP